MDLSIITEKYNDFQDKSDNRQRTTDNQISQTLRTRTANSDSRNKFRKRRRADKRDRLEKIPSIDKRRTL